MYQRNALNDVLYSDKCRKACNIKHCICMCSQRNTKDSVWFSQLTTSSNFLHFVEPSVIIDCPTNGLSICQLPYWRYAWNDVRCSDKCGKECNIKHARSQQHTKDAVFWLAHMMLYNFPLFVKRHFTWSDRLPIIINNIIAKMDYKIILMVIQVI